VSELHGGWYESVSGRGRSHWFWLDDVHSICNMVARDEFWRLTTCSCRQSCRCCMLALNKVIGKAPVL